MVDIKDNFLQTQSKLIKSLIQSWTKAVSGNKFIENEISTKENLVNFLRKVLDNELEDHLEYLANKQGVKLVELPKIEKTSNPTEELEYLRILTSNIHMVQKGQSGGITPRISRDLNGMDCSMSTWVMQHEIRKTGLNFDFGAPSGHAIGIITLSNNEIYYADGQNGFIEKIDIEEKPLINNAKILIIKNYTEIQSKQSRFFPEFVFVSPNSDLTSTISNIDSMLYKQYIGEFTEDEKIKLGNDAKIVEQMQPYAKEFIATMNNTIRDTNKNEINRIQDTLFPEVKAFRQSEEALKDITRLHKKLTNFTK